MIVLEPQADMGGSPSTWEASLNLSYNMKCFATVSVSLLNKSNYFFFLVSYLVHIEVTWWYIFWLPKKKKESILWECFRCFQNPKAIIFCFVPHAAFSIADSIILLSSFLLRLPISLILLEKERHFLLTFRVEFRCLVFYGFCVWSCNYPSRLV